jgi:hypothetical protein
VTGTFIKQSPNKKLSSNNYSNNRSNINNNNNNNTFSSSPSSRRPFSASSSPNKSNNNSNNNNNTYTHTNTYLSESHLMGSAPRLHSPNAVLRDGVMFSSAAGMLGAY